jgi:hypothetical protein
LAISASVIAGKRSIFRRVRHARKLLAVHFAPRTGLDTMCSINMFAGPAFATSTLALRVGKSVLALFLLTVPQRTSPSRRSVAHSLRSFLYSPEWLRQP